MSTSMAINILQQSTDLVERYANCISKDLVGNTQIIDDLASYVLYFSKTVEYHEASDKIFQDIVDEIDSASDELDCNDILVQFDERIKNVEEELMVGEGTEKYNNFLKFYRKQGSRIDDEITAVCQNLNTIDPVSKLPITDPVRNKQCGHVYEKRTIIELIERNPRTKCPIVGCNSHEFIKKSDLMPDTATKRSIIQYAGNAQKKAKLSE